MLVGWIIDLIISCTTLKTNEIPCYFPFVLKFSSDFTDCPAKLSKGKTETVAEDGGRSIQLYCGGYSIGEH